MLETGIRRSLQLTSPDIIAAESVDERTLVTAAKHDASAFATLYERYHNRVFWYYFRRLADVEEAEDVASLTFTKALSALHSCRNDRFRSWLFGIASNVVRDSCRAHRNDRPLTDALALSDPHADLSDLALFADSQRRVAELLARLPEGQRRVVELRLAGLKGKEVAAVLGRPHVWVRVTQLRAYERLRRILADEPDLLS